MLRIVAIIILLSIFFVLQSMIWIGIGLSNGPIEEARWWMIPILYSTPILIFTSAILYLFKKNKWATYLSMPIFFCILFEIYYLQFYSLNKKTIENKNWQNFTSWLTTEEKKGELFRCKKPKSILLIVSIKNKKYLYYEVYKGNSPPKQSYLGSLEKHISSLSLEQKNILQQCYKVTDQGVGVSALEALSSFLVPFN